MLLQSKHLSMTGLGVLDHQDLLDGVHLRWSFDPALGFPRYGFRLYKGFFDEKAAAGLPASYFPNRAAEWWEYHDPATRSIAKDGLTVRYPQSSELMTGGVSLSLREKVQVNLPVASGKAAVIIHMLPKDQTAPTFEKEDFYLLEQGNQLFYPDRYADPETEKNKRIIEEPIRARVIKSRREAINSKTLKTRYEILKPFNPIPIKDIPYDFGDDPLALEIELGDGREIRRTTTHSLKKGQNLIILDSDQLQKFSLQISGSVKHLENSKLLLTCITWLPIAILDKYTKWEPVGTYCLPVEYSEHPCTAFHEGRSAWEVANNRVKLKAVNNRKCDYDRFENEVRRDLEMMVSKFPQPQQDVIRQVPVTESSTKGEAPDPVELPLLQLAMMSALEPEMAQILGLYGLDESAKKGERTHYKIEGLWNKATLGKGYGNDQEKLKDMYQLDFHGLLRDTTFSIRRNGFRFAAGASLMPEGSHGIRVNGGLHITCPRAIAMFSMQLKPLTSYTPVVRVYDSDGGMNSYSYDPKLIVEAIAKGITQIRIYGDFVLYSFHYADSNYAWINQDLQLDVNRDLPAPEQLSTYLLPGKGYIETEKGGIYSSGTIGLKWKAPAYPIQQQAYDGGGNRIIRLRAIEEDTPVLYRLQRAFMKKPQDVLDDRDYQVINRGDPVLLSRQLEMETDSADAQAYPESWPEQTAEEIAAGWPPLFYIDAGDKDEKGQWREFLKKELWYAYRVQGIDLFGRISRPSEPDHIQVLDRTPPPHPQPQQAKYLHMKDHLLDVAERNWSEREGRPGFRIQWVWPESLQQQAPDAQAFRLYFKAGRWNLFEGNVESVQAENRERSIVFVHFAERGWNVPRNQLNGRFIRQDGRNFKIVQNEASRQVLRNGKSFTELKLIVNNLTLEPLERPQANKPISVKIDANSPLYKSNKQSANWTADSKGTYVATIPLAKGKRQSDRSSSGKILRWLAYDWFISESEIPSSMRLEPDAWNPVVHGCFGITTIDDSGNESAVCPSLPVTAVLRETPPAPSISDIGELWSKYPDYYGRSQFEMTWSVPAAHEPYYHQVFRAMDRVLMMVDRDLHVAGHLEGGGNLHRDTLERLWQETTAEPGTRAYEVQQDLQELDEKLQAWHQAAENIRQRKMEQLQKAYEELRNDTWQYIASLPENQKAYMTVSSPLDPTDNSRRKSDGRMFHLDLIEGKGRNRYFYQVATMDRAGNRGKWSGATAPVNVPDVMPPKAPVWTKAISGRGQATLRWRRNREPGMLHYEIYRTQDLAKKDAPLQQWGAPIAIIPASEAGVPLQPKVVQGQILLDAIFSEPAQTIEGIEQSMGRGQDELPFSIQFGGFISLTANLLVDEADVNIRYRDLDGNLHDLTGEAHSGKVKIRLTSAEMPIQSIEGIYDSDDTAQAHNLFAGIAAGRMLLGAMLEDDDAGANGDLLDNNMVNNTLLRTLKLSIKYIDLNQMQHVVLNTPHELEFVDRLTDAGVYIYRMIAVRQGIIGKTSAGKQQTQVYKSPPAKSISAQVLKEV